MRQPQREGEGSKVDVSEESARVDAIRREVTLDEIIRDRYPELWNLLVPQLSLRGLMRLPSPYAPAGRPWSLVLFYREGIWCDPLRPSHVKGDVIGFVMAFERCDREAAIDILWDAHRRLRNIRIGNKLHLELLPEVERVRSAEVAHAVERLRSEELDARMAALRCELQRVLPDSFNKGLVVTPKPKRTRPKE
ncbi:MAG: hypothetical protein IT377_07310 [Polyangiaceae bacterium]|nr:hypothetical protein [Polyangiaceae bacterium]